ncbi:hypothetical protein PC9H_004326 [Pleurotus ostreatus]|uniref:HMG box domain-containing protein n=1 Tax=Pleurotus ostreatus TaxID=5322 RepID=A0A8H7A013_PLEOS|nr:uncharacterized protein PC9H_004326 [Pleurotus ostreatus]KAF7437485.1 hypothetical protein PC9H_004326 [Pleurotus ostreatus]
MLSPRPYCDAETRAGPSIYVAEFFPMEDSMQEAPLTKPNHRKKRPSNHIPRPPNAFILFRSNFIRSQRVSQTVEASHSTLSKIIGITWQNLPDQERQEWHGKAKRALDEHRRKYPQYAFRPQHSKKGGGDGAEVAAASGLVKRKVRDIEPRDNKRCAKIAELLIQGKKGDELDAAILEYDKHHVPVIVTRFEEPLTAEEYQSSSSPACSVSNTSDDENLTTRLPVMSPNVPYPQSPTSYPSPCSPVGQSLSPITFDDSYTPNSSPPSSSPLSHPISWDPLSLCPGPPPISAPPTFPSSSYNQHDNLAMPTPRRNLSIDTAFLAASSGWSFPHAAPHPMSVSCQTLTGSPLNGGPYDFAHDYVDQYTPVINPFDIPSPEHQFRSHYHDVDPACMSPGQNDLLFDSHHSWGLPVDVGGTFIHGYETSPSDASNSIPRLGLPLPSSIVD